jgi:hypothetical protein
MNRLSWDTTAPRRLNGKRTAAQPRPEDSGLVEAEADLIRVAWDKPHRIGPFQEHAAAERSQKARPLRRAFARQASSVRLSRSLGYDVSSSMPSSVTTAVSEWRKPPSSSS